MFKTRFPSLSTTGILDINPLLLAAILYLAASLASTA